MVKKPGVVWNYYNKKVDGAAVIAFCKFCERSYMQNATRMEKHLARCEKATPEVKQLFLRVSTSKRVNRARLMGAKMPIDWLKQHRELGLDVSTLTEADLDDINEWNRQKEMVNEDTAVQSIILTEDQTQEEDINWEGDEEEVDESPAKKVNDAAKSAKVWVKQLPDSYVITQNDYPPESNKNCNGRSSGDHDVKHIHIQSVTSLSPGHQPTTSTSSSSTTTAAAASSTLGHSPLESRILQEKVLESRALRKIAELELQRKKLECERYQWEYERDKAQSEIRWEHETRMMEIKEEHEKKLIQVHVQEG
ncbi:hypothetical protein HCN44_008088 [Aphidius gifuensis]|uniref:BED-type domain-containing protein n=1 Tax=Aphidius gifuensis TaxID=684658 RepID=A0A835CM28_APHGI|nr:uncharacterized protein LOC122857794 isoform X1 [Aphidius gifuensis]KAF7989414.1 hypothetical protein HCN44_008088 [Aphidius gifuensis]